MSTSPKDHVRTGRCANFSVGKPFRTLSCTNFSDAEPLFRSVSPRYRSERARSFSTLKDSWSSVRMVARDRFWRLEYQDGRSRGRSTTTQTSLNALLAFLIVLTCLHILPSTSISAATAHNVDTQIQGAKMSLGVPSVPQQEATDAALIDNEKATPHVFLNATSQRKGVSKFDTPKMSENVAALTQETTSLAHSHVTMYDTRLTELSTRQIPTIVDGPPLLTATPARDAHASRASKGETDLFYPALAYKGGAIDVIHLARTHVEPASNITAAICYKTMFGDIDIGLVLQWVAYNRLLGFDHVFMFYRPEMKNAPRFDELQALPFVTLSKWTSGNRGNYYSQRITEKLCLSEQKFAGSYDWAMIADIDEYLWLPEEYDGVKSFLHHQQSQNMTYVSLGKRMYTLDHRTDAAASNYKLDSMAKDPPFVYSQYPFYMDHFCYGIRKGEAICPTWRGRAKVIVRPAHHQWIDVHGIYNYPIETAGAVHYHPKFGHFMEWPHIFSEHNITKRTPVDFTVHEEEEVHIHNLKKGFTTDKNGRYHVKYDGLLEQWFHYVINRARVPALNS